uniref:Basic helix-loop-helix family, member e41 n=1 Tax=Scleropages formosus TaxID=113540 RepID=A0A8C9V0X8_SCLFO
MGDRIPRLQERQSIDHANFLGVEYSSLYMCKSKRGMKREESKDAYKLPHRLIEKKRRDRINECIGQLKDLLPEHLKLTTLGHLEKAVVLELTLKHLNALTAVTEQQHQTIVALQSGDRSTTKSSIQADVEAFHSGFQTCAKEVLQYLRRSEKWSAREERCAQLVGHLQKVCAQLLPGEPQANCVPVIQRTHNGELNENDTDTDSGYGGEAEKHELGKAELECGGAKAQGAAALRIKQETEEEPRAKRARLDGHGPRPGGAAVVKPEPSARCGPDAGVLNSLMGLGAAAPFGQGSFCMPFYFINPSAAASYVPLMDKSTLEKYVLSATAAVGSPFPLLYPGFPATFPGAGSGLWGGSPGAQSQKPEPEPDTDSSNELELESLPVEDLEECGDEEEPQEERGSDGD